MKPELERGRHDRHALQRAGHDDERVAFVGLALRLRSTRSR